MSSINRRYELSKEGDKDLEEIFDYTESQYDFDQAVEYLLEFEITFELLIENPEIGRMRDEIKQGLRSFPKLSHVVFYRILKGGIRIVRVLHESRDLPQFFP